MFTGAHRARVDDKGRVAIPAAFRKQLTEGSYVSVSQDNVLAIYPPDLWAALAEELKSPLPGPDQRALARTLYPLSDSFEPDGQGRISLQPEQRRLSGIDTPSTVVVIGTGSRVEIWPEGRWHSYSADAQGRFTEFADRVIQGH
ncbi:MAG: division/cell wall cluster transcriptional repressor MraZ [Candidatus Dormiibacterota bacterium]